jgi:hypothetical protein
MEVDMPYLRHRRRRRRRGLGEVTVALVPCPQAIIGRNPKRGLQLPMHMKMTALLG